MIEPDALFSNITIKSAYQSEIFNEYETASSIPELVLDCFVIFISFCIFAMGIIGNLLVVLVVIKNSHMRTITNMFIVNLAIGDILVILICLPPTILTDVTGNWYFGKTMCKIIPYIQVTSTALINSIFIYIN